MSTEVTTHVGLKKPSATDYYDIDVFNSNADLIDAEFKDYDDRIKHMESNFDVSKGLRSEPIAIQSHVTSFPENTVSGGRVDIVGFKGLSLVNSIKNGDLRNGSEHFYGTYGSLSLDNQVLKCTADGSQTAAYITQEIGPSQLNIKTFYFARVRANNDAVNIQFRIQEMDTWDPKVIATKTTKLDEYQEIYGIENNTTWDNKRQRIMLMHNYADASTANGKTFEFDGNSGLYAIPLTGSLSNLTADQLAYMVRVSGYWEGIKSVDNPKLMSRGKNIVDSQLLRQAGIDSNGNETNDNSRILTGYIEVDKTKEYTRPLLNHAEYVCNGVYGYDLDKNFISGMLLSNPLTMIDGVSFIRLTLRRVDSAPITENDLKKIKECIQVEEGSELSEYEPYKYDTEVISGQFKSISNTVFDKLEVRDGKYRKVSELSNVIKLTGRENWSAFSSDDSNTVRVAIAKFATDFYHKTLGDYVIDFINTRFPNKANYALDSEGAFINYVGDLYVRINKSLLSEVSLDGVKLYFDENPFEVIYRKDTVSYYEYDNVNLSCYNKGSIVMSSDSGLLPEITLDTPINQGAMIKDVSETAKTNNDLLQGLKNVQSAPIKLTQDDPVKSVILKGQANPKIEISGKRVTNLLQGDLGDYSKDWVLVPNSGSTVEYSDEQAFVGSKSMKIIRNAQNGYAYLDNINIKTNHKYAFIQRQYITSYIGNPVFNLALYDNETFDNIQQFTSHGLGDITLNKWDTKVYFIDVKASNGTKRLGFGGGGTGTVTGYFDGLEIIDMTVDNLSEKDILDSVGNNYIKGTQETQDILIERRGENLLTEPIVIYSTHKVMTVERLEPNAIYTLSAQDDKGLRIDPYYSNIVGDFNSAVGSVDDITSRTFTATELGAITLYLINGERDNISFEDIGAVLVKGTYKPTQYIPAELDLVFLDEYLGDTDRVTIDGSAATVEREWSKPIKLGGNQNWSTSVTDGVGYKEVSLVLDNATADSILTKFNGKGIDFNVSKSGGDQYNTSTHLWLTIPDNNSGWGENYEPTPDEIKAYFNGWVISDVGGALYSSGDKYWWKRYQGIGASQILASSITIESNTSLGANILPKEKAYGDITETYTLRYKLATPETYTINLDGVLGFKEGVNHLSIRTGVRREKVKTFSTGGNYVINQIGTLGYAFDKKAKRINALIFKDGKEWMNNRDWTIRSGLDGSFSYGEADAYISDALYESNYADKDIYAIYETLPEENNSGIFTATATYTDSTVEAVESLLNIVDEQAKRLSIAESELGELKKIEVYEPTLLNGWENYGSTYKLASVSKNGNGEVRLSGLIMNSATVAGSAIMSLPSGFRPKKDLYIVTTGHNGSDIVGAIKVIASNGNITSSNISGNVRYLALDAISFMAGE